jgi:hypothetical protein
LASLEELDTENRPELGNTAFILTTPLMLRSVELLKIDSWGSLSASPSGRNAGRSIA